MATKTHALDELNLNDISGELIQNELLKVVKIHLNSNSVKLYTEHGSKKGMSWRITRFSTEKN